MSKNISLDLTIDSCKSSFDCISDVLYHLSDDLMNQGFSREAFAIDAAIDIIKRQQEELMNQKIIRDAMENLVNILTRKD